MDTFDVLYRKIWLQLGLRCRVPFSHLSFPNDPLSNSYGRLQRACENSDDYGTFDSRSEVTHQPNRSLTHLWSRFASLIVHDNAQERLRQNSERLNCDILN